MKNISFLIDGFNVYHSLKDAAKVLGTYEIKWFNYQSFCRRLLKIMGNDSQINNILWFTSLPKHMQKTNPNKINRHLNYIKAIESKGVMAVMGKFKKVTKKLMINFSTCNVTFYEEKQTDVAIGVQIIDEFVRYKSDIVAIVSGDTDLIPAIKKAQDMFPSKDVWIIFPYNRSNDELRRFIGNNHINIKAKHYRQHIMESPVVLPNGDEIHKPAKWK